MTPYSKNEGRWRRTNGTTTIIAATKSPMSQRNEAKSKAIFQKQNYSMTTGLRSCVYNTPSIPVIVVTLLGISVFLFAQWNMYLQMESLIVDNGSEDGTSEKDLPIPKPDTSHCPALPLRLITIRGERHHGTNWIRSIINSNIDPCQVRYCLTSKCTVDADGAYGWKHGVLRPEEKIRRQDVLLVVTKDVFPWLLSMHKNPYKARARFLRHNNNDSRERIYLQQPPQRHPQPNHQSIHVQGGHAQRIPVARLGPGQQPPRQLVLPHMSLLGQKVTTQMQGLKKGNPQQKRPMPKIPLEKFLRIPWIDGCQFPRYYRKTYCPVDRAPNVIHLRTLKYKNWLSNTPQYFGFPSKPPHSTRYHLRYESIVDLGQEATVGKFLHSYGWNWKNGTTFADTTGYISRNKDSNGVFSQREVLDFFSVNDLKFVLSQLDLEFEKNVLNYTYDYVKEYIQEKENSQSDGSKTVETGRIAMINSTKH